MRIKVQANVIQTDRRTSCTMASTVDSWYENSTIQQTVLQLSLPFPQPHWIRTAIATVITVLILLFNIPVLFIVPKIESLSNSTGIAMISLALADLGAGVSNCTTLLHYYIMGYYSYNPTELVCQTTAVLLSSCCSISISSLAFFNLDKYFTIAYPFHYKSVMTVKRAICLLTLCWIFTFLVLILNVFNVGDLHIRYYRGQAVCLPDFVSSPVYSLCALIVLMVIPTIIIMRCIIGIYHIAKHQKQSIIQQGSVQNNTTTFTKRNAKIVKTLVIMTAGFYLMWSPYFIFCLFWEIVTGSSNKELVDFTFGWMAATNSLVNPLIYIPTIKAFRYV